MERRDRRFNNGLDEFIDENYAKICNNLEEEIINIFEKEISTIRFEVEEEFLDVLYKEKEFEEKINNYYREDLENIFFEKISFIKEDLILELIENKILNFEEKYQEMININKEKQQNQIQEEKQKS